MEWSNRFWTLNIDLPPHADYGWLPELRLTVQYFPSQFVILTASATCLDRWSLYNPETLMLKLGRSPMWSSSWWLWMNELVLFFSNSLALVYRFLIWCERKITCADCMSFISNKKLRNLSMITITGGGWLWFRRKTSHQNHT